MGVHVYILNLRECRVHYHVENGNDLPRILKKMIPIIRSKWRIGDERVRLRVRYLRLKFADESGGGGRFRSCFSST